jgi:hypothetical protein
MIKIEKVVFPLNLGTADKINVSISANASALGARVSYILIDSTAKPLKSLSNGFFILTDKEFKDNGSDKTWVLNYVASKLGVKIL